MFTQSKLKLLTLLLLFQHYLLVPLCGQNADIMFEDSILNNPVDNACWFDNSIETVYVSRYLSQTNTNRVMLENGYAEYILSEHNRWLSTGSFAVPIQIDIVFTQYPKRRDDWITNYYELLANRLKALFLLDSRLNSVDISWRLIMQSSCSSQEEAKQLFHGVVIQLEISKISSIEPLPFVPLEDPQNYTPPKLSCSQNKALASLPENDSEELQKILYPESVKKRRAKHYLPPKVKRPDEPGCPAFTSRMEHPRRRIWQLIFGR